MSSKPFIFLGLLFVVVVLLSSEEVAATARDLKRVEDAIMESHGDGFEDVKRDHHGHGHGHVHRPNCQCCSYNHGRCRRCCSFAGEAADEEPQAKPGN